jgi:hypothetical protein
VGRRYGSAAASAATTTTTAATVVDGIVATAAANLGLDLHVELLRCWLSLMQAL